MKTVSDWTHQMNLHGYSVSKLIGLAQADAYNQAIDDAAESAEIEEWNSCAYRVYKQSILKLRK